LAFLDEDELAPAEPGSRRYGADRQRQYLVRRFIALGVGVVILILLLLGIRGCLDARKERGFENYARDLDAIVTESNQLSATFFDRLENPERNTSELTLQAQIGGDRNTAEGLLERVQGLDTPGELEGAQGELEQAFELRRDGLAGIAEQIPTALGNDAGAARQAIDSIVGDMQEFLASDVLYARARTDIVNVLDDEGIAAEVKESVFLPDPIEQWLDPVQLTTLITAAAGEEIRCDVCGTELLSTTLNPGGVALTPDSLNTVTLQGTPEIDVEVQNGGDTEVTGLVVSFELTGGAEPIQGETTIDRIPSGGIETATLAFESEPETGTELSLEVTVSPVPGETLTDNNTSAYPILFE
jgi:uncharacterized protein (TIGR02588 family)